MKIYCPNIGIVTFPDLPTDIDRTKYPYAGIAISGTADNIQGSLMFRSNPWYYDADTEKFVTDAPYNDACYNANANGESWTRMWIDGTVETDSSTDRPGGVWFNYDIINNETGEVMLKNYDVTSLPPVPVEVNRETYPYVLLTCDTNTAYLYCTSKPGQYNPTTSTVEIPVPFNIKIYYILNGSTKWSSNVETEITDATNSTISRDAIYYSDYDILNIETGKVEIPSSEGLSGSNVSEIQYLVPESKLKALAKSIRSKTSKTEDMDIDEMISEIGNISGGGSTVLSSKGVSF